MQKTGKMPIHAVCKEEHIMADHPNAALHRRAHEAFSSQDMDTLIQLIAEDTVWHIPGRNQLSGDLIGRDAVLGFFQRAGALSERNLVIVGVHDFFGIDDRSVALVRVTAERNGKTLEGNLIEVVHWRDGQMSENWHAVGDQYAWDEFWS